MSATNTPAGTPRTDPLRLSRGRVPDAGTDSGRSVRSLSGFAAPFPAVALTTAARAISRISLSSAGVRTARRWSRKSPFPAAEAEACCRACCGAGLTYEATEASPRVATSLLAPPAAAAIARPAAPAAMRRTAARTGPVRFRNLPNKVTRRPPLSPTPERNPRSRFRVPRRSPRRTVGSRSQGVSRSQWVVFQTHVVCTPRTLPCVPSPWSSSAIRPRHSPGGAPRRHRARAGRPAILWSMRVTSGSCQIPLRLLFDSPACIPLRGYRVTSPLYGRATGNTILHTE